MRLRELTSEEIKKFALREKVRRIAVENFLMTVTNCGTYENAIANLLDDRELYKWNQATFNAIRDGIMLAANG